jgi:hypothetical protein
VPYVNSVEFAKRKYARQDLRLTPKLLAVQIEPECNNCDTPWGFQLSHFNGAAPITPYSSILLADVLVWKMAWDNSNHLYILGTKVGGGAADEKLYVFTVSPTTITEAAGSPYVIPNMEISQIVVSK